MVNPNNINCPFCQSREIIVLDEDNRVYKCGSSHVWKNLEGHVVKLRKLSLAEYSSHITEFHKDFVFFLNFLIELGYLPFKPEIDISYLYPLREGLLKLISEGNVEAYIDPEHHVNYVLTRALGIDR